MSKIFISYRRDDSAYVAGRMHEQLGQRYGKEELFKDIDSIPLGTQFVERIADALTKCRVVLVVIGKRWLEVQSASGNRRLDDENDYLRFELQEAIKRKVPIIPVLFEGISMPTVKDLPQGLELLPQFQAMALRPDPDYHADVQRLFKRIDQLVETPPVIYGSVVSIRTCDGFYVTVDMKTEELIATSHENGAWGRFQVVNPHDPANSLPRQIIYGDKIALRAVANNKLVNVPTSWLVAYSSDLRVNAASVQPGATFVVHDPGSRKMQDVVRFHRELALETAKKTYWRVDGLLTRRLHADVEFIDDWEIFFLAPSDWIGQ